MIKLKLSGGLGNQLFQIAAANHIAYMLNKKFTIDLSFYNRDIENNTSRNFVISKIFNLPIKYVEFSLLERLIIKLKFTNFLAFTILNDNNYRYFKSLNEKNIFLMQGYFQNHLFFKDSIEILKKSINLKRNTLKNSVSIHIRRGDYLLPDNQNYFAKCSLDYYKNSILKLSKLINLDNHSFYIFSDDIDWCKRNIKLNYKTIFRDSYDEVEDFLFMSNCENNIISNSTFSWWAAYLNDYKYKRVIAPKEWYKHKTTTNNFYPKSWIKMKN